MIEQIREEKVRGNICAKIFALKQGYDTKILKWGKTRHLQSKGTIDKELGKILLEGQILRINYQRETMDTQVQYYQKLLASGLNGPDEKALAVLNKMFKINPDCSANFFCAKESLEVYSRFTKDEYEQFKNLFYRFMKDINKLTHESNCNSRSHQTEKPYYFYGSSIPLMRMLDYLNVEPNR